MRFRALRSTTDAAVGSRRLPQKAGENFIGEKILVMTKNTASKNRQRTVADFFTISHYIFIIRLASAITAGIVATESNDEAPTACEA